MRRKPTALIAFLLSLLLSTQVWAEEKTVLAFGDSLFSGYGLSQEDGFVPQLAVAVEGALVINAGVPGDSTAGGLARLDWSLFDGPDLVLLELGANDALRGLDPAQTKANLAAMLEILNERKIPTILIGMRASPSMGQEYARAFDAIYPALAKQFEVPLYPFLLEGVAANSQLNQADGIHPNAAGVRKIVEQLAPLVIKTLKLRKVPG